MEVGPTAEIGGAAPNRFPDAARPLVADRSPLP